MNNNNCYRFSHIIDNWTSTTNMIESHVRAIDTQDLPTERSVITDRMSAAM